MYKVQSHAALQAQLKHEAHDLVEEFTEKNKHNVLNAVSDSITAFTGFGILLKDTEGRGILFRTLSRIFSGLSDTAKAFMIIASTDILLGYHSEEGWTAAIHLITHHYGSEVEVSWCSCSHLALVCMDDSWEIRLAYWLLSCIILHVQVKKDCNACGDCPS